MATATAALVPPLNLRKPDERRRNFVLRPIPMPLRPGLSLSARRPRRPCSRGAAYPESSRLPRCFSAISASPASAPTSYEFSNGTSEVEVRLELLGSDTYRDVSVDTHDLSLRIRVQREGSLTTLLETSHLYGRIKPSETIWYIDENQLVVSLKKYDRDLKWPDLVDSWESLTAGVVQLLKGTSIHLVGNSTEINQKVAKELAHGLGYTPLSTGELLEKYAQQSVDSWMSAEGADSVQVAEEAVLESLNSHVRAVVATLGGQIGVASKADKWRHLYAGFTIWLSQSEATDEASARDEVRRNMEDGTLGYSNADVVVKLGGWESDAARNVAQACLSALKQLILSDKKLTGKKSLYIRLGCRGDWPNIKPPGWDPSTGYTSDI